MSLRQMIRFSPFAILLVFLMACSSSGGLGANTVRGSGNVTTEAREVSAFSAIEFASQGDVNVTYGDIESLTIEAEDNLIQYIETTVEDGRLIIRTQSNTILNETRPIRLEIVVTSLDDVVVSGSGELTVLGVNSDAFTATLSGSGIIFLGGEADSFNATVSGSGTIDAGALTTETAAAAVPGSGSIIVNAADSLDATISGSGSIVYLGSPTVTQNVSGSGSIEPRGS